MKDLNLSNQLQNYLKDLLKLKILKFLLHSHLPSLSLNFPYLINYRMNNYQNQNKNNHCYCCSRIHCNISYLLLNLVFLLPLKFVSINKLMFSTHESDSHSLHALFGPLTSFEGHFCLSMLHLINVLTIL